MPNITDALLSRTKVTGEAIEIKFIPLSYLQNNLPDLLWERNAKLHDLGQLYESIERFGFSDPPKYDQNLNGGNGGFVYGNGRIEALVEGLLVAKISGLEPPPGIAVSKADGDWAIPVKFGLDCQNEAEAEAFGIDHNNLTMGGSDLSVLDIAKIWDTAKYSALLRSLSTQNTLPITVSRDDIASILLDAANQLGMNEDPTSPEDEEAATGIMDAGAADDYVPRVKAGEIWKLGKHTIAVGSCTIPGNVTALVDAHGSRAVCCWTDPPYGVSYVGKTAEALTIDNDMLADGDLQEFIEAAIEGIKIAATPGAPVYMAHPAGALQNIFFQAIVNSGLTLKQTLVWVKNTFAMGRSDYHYQHEPIYYAYLPGGDKPSRMGNGGWFGAHNATSVFEYNKPSANRLHPTMKPVELIVAMLKNSAPPGGGIYEPFLGSGSTLMAADQLGMNCLGFELDTRYASVVIDRWEAASGKTAELIGELPGD
jgi:DNA modification methylase